MTIRLQAQQLVQQLKANPSMMVRVTPPRDTAPALKHKPQAGTKVHNGKPNFHRQIADYSAVELLIDLEDALEWDDTEDIVRFYFQLRHLVG